VSAAARRSASEQTKLRRRRASFDTHVTRDFCPLCRQITDFVWKERRLLVSWLVIPEASVDAHSDVGLVGVVTANGLP